MTMTTPMFEEGKREECEKKKCWSRSLRFAKVDRRGNIMRK
jgi:hypothetical protein